MSKLVSILIPVFNREAIIADTIQSALNQTYKNIEVVVVDNASTDNTWEVIRDLSVKDSRIKAFRNESNLGPVRNWARCAEEATGKYGKILWSDDLIAPDFVERTMLFMADDVGFVYSGVSLFASDPLFPIRTTNILSETKLYPMSFFCKRALFGSGVPMSPGCALFRMNDLRKNLLIDVPNQVGSDFSMHAIGNDLLLFLLAANDYAKFGHVAEPLSHFRVHDGSISIASTDGKLSLHYALAKAWFVEHFRPEFRARYEAEVNLLLLRYRKHLNKYNISSSKDFFAKESHSSSIVNYLLFWNALVRRVAGKLMLKLRVWL